MDAIANCNTIGCPHAGTVLIPENQSLGMMDDRICPPCAVLLMVRYQDMATVVRKAMRSAVERIWPRAEESSGPTPEVSR